MWINCLFVASEEEELELLRVRLSFRDVLVLFSAGFIFLIIREM
jgi:hypothetical protein